MDSDRIRKEVTLEVDPERLGPLLDLIAERLAARISGRKPLTQTGSVQFPVNFVLPEEGCDD